MAEPTNPGETTVWTFPHKSRCRKEEGGCGSLQTYVLTTQGQMQYRQCLKCGRRYKVVGWRI